MINQLIRLSKQAAESLVVTVQAICSPECWQLRLSLFILGYVFLSVIGAYNLAHLLAFCYMLWLLETKE